MTGARARTALTGTRFATLRWLAETGSTNSDVLAAARDGAAAGTTIVADHQSAGRGRAGRTWEAPPNASLLFSVLLRPPAATAPLATAAMAVSLAGGVEEIAGFRPDLKWPNDLVVERAGRARKLAGVLAEADWPAGSDIASGHRNPDPDVAVTVVVGAGVNVNWPGEVPAHLAGIAIACNEVVGTDVDREDLLVAVLRRLDGWYDELRGGSAERLVTEWRSRLVTLGRRVRVELGADDVAGTAVDVDGSGHLVVDTDDRGRQTFAVGDVVHLR